MINYAVAGKWSDVVHALTLTENGGKEPTAINIVGDDGLAMGILQQHPAFIADYIAHAGITVSDDYPTMSIKLAAAYLEKWYGVGRDLVIQGYNQGIYGVMRKVDPLRAPKYLADFTIAMSKIKGAWPSA